MQLCTEWRNQLPFPFAVEPKIDGVRCLVTVDPITRKVAATTRHGRSIAPSVRHITRTLLSHVRELTLFDGELYDESYKATKKSISSCSSSLNYHIFDLISEPHLELWERKYNLDRALGRCRNKRIHVVNWRIAHTSQDLAALYSAYIASGFEGAVIKKLSSLPIDPMSWFKAKPRKTVSGKIVGRVRSNMYQVLLCRRDGSNEIVMIGPSNLGHGSNVEIDIKQNSYVFYRRI